MTKQEAEAKSQEIFNRVHHIVYTETGAIINGYLHCDHALADKYALMCAQISYSVLKNTVLKDIIVTH